MKGKRPTWCWGKGLPQCYNLSLGLSITKGYCKKCPYFGKEEK